MRYFVSFPKKIIFSLFLLSLILSIQGCNTENPGSLTGSPLAQSPQAILQSPSTLMAQSPQPQPQQQSGNPNASFLQNPATVSQPPRQPFRFTPEQAAALTDPNIPEAEKKNMWELATYQRDLNDPEYGARVRLLQAEAEALKAEKGLSE